MSKFKTVAVFNGTKLPLAVSGNSVDRVMERIRKRKDCRNASVFMFYSRKTNNLVDVRFN